MPILDLVVPAGARVTTGLDGTINVVLPRPALPPPSVPLITPSPPVDPNVLITAGASLLGTVFNILAAARPAADSTTTIPPGADLAALLEQLGSLLHPADTPAPIVSPLVVETPPVQPAPVVEAGTDHDKIRLVYAIAAEEGVIINPVNAERIIGLPDFSEERARKEIVKLRPAVDEPESNPTASSESTEVDDAMAILESL